MKTPVPHKTVPSRDTCDRVQHVFHALATRERAGKLRPSVIVARGRTTGKDPGLNPD